MKVVEVAVAGIVIEATGTGSRVLLLASDTAVPFGAAPLNPTVHVVVTPEFKVFGLHASEETVTDAAGATKLTVVDWETPLGTIAEASFEYPLSVPVPSTAVLT